MTFKANTSMMMTQAVGFGQGVQALTPDLSSTLKEQSLVQKRLGGLMQLLERDIDLQERNTRTFTGLSSRTQE